MKKTKKTKELNSEQLAALNILQSECNVFLTGAAGTGKSFLLQEFRRQSATHALIPILASTGAAAILVGGRTFHSYFGLGILEGGIAKTIERATGNRRLQSRLKEAHTLIIDEISMISGPTLGAAEAIARKVRGNSSPWGGIRIIAVGDFSQLPPVNPFSQVREWAFLDPSWTKSEFRPVVLKKIMRSKDTSFLEVLSDVRRGKVTPRVRAFLELRAQALPSGEFTTLLPRRDAVDQHNMRKLSELRTDGVDFETQFEGAEKDIQAFRKHSPIPDLLTLKPKALVMLRQNDPDGRFVNGSLAIITKIEKTSLELRLQDGSGSAKGDTIQLKPVDFTLLNAEGEPVVKAKNFPLTLAWAFTIHKAQGATLDAVHVDLSHAWEPGQAYVALSRARSPDRLFVKNWYSHAIHADPEVSRFYELLEEESLLPRPRGQENVSLSNTRSAEGDPDDSEWDGEPVNGQFDF